MLHSFDKTVSIHTDVLLLKNIEEVKQVKSTPIIVRGAGMSYCPASAAEGSATIDVSGCNKVLSKYKIRSMPYYFIAILLVYKKAFMSYPKWFYKIIKWV